MREMGHCIIVVPKVQSYNLQVATCKLLVYIITLRNIFPQLTQLFTWLKEKIGKKRFLHIFLKSAKIIT